MKGPVVYIIPSLLSDAGLTHIPAAVPAAIQDCQVFFAEHERTARRFFKQLLPDMVIDDYEWHAIHKAEDSVRQVFLQSLGDGKNAGIVSEAGCPGVADPGQLLVGAAQEAGYRVQPVTGPSAVLLALMASGMNGQQFQFHGYLPVDAQARSRKIRELEAESAQKNCTQIFIETPYRNNQLVAAILRSARPATRFCIAANLTGPEEWIRTMTIAAWKQQVPDLHKIPAIFLLHQD